jgi:indolepyruvate ferredoxin oxidoreductase alpha subunit
MAKAAFELSETYDVPVCSLTTRSPTAVAVERQRGAPMCSSYEKNIGKNVMMPGMAKVRHVWWRSGRKACRIREKRRQPAGDNGTKIGVMPPARPTKRQGGAGDRASYSSSAGLSAADGSSATLRGAWRPLVIEELDPFIESTSGLLARCIGKGRQPFLGSPPRARFGKSCVRGDGHGLQAPIRARPAGRRCSARLPPPGVYYMLDKLKSRDRRYRL